MGFPGGSDGKESALKAGDPRNWEDPLEKGMATHYSILAWRIPWREEPSGLQPMSTQKVGHNPATFSFLFFLENEQGLFQVNYCIFQ